jgi:uncharacterized protein (TIGR03437 family)
VKPDGTVYFTSEECVFALGPTGVLTKIAGTGRHGFTGDGGLALNAQLGVGELNSGPGGGIALDARGNLYLADSENSRIRKISTSGIIVTLAGNGALGLGNAIGPAQNIALGVPASVAVDGTGNVFFGDGPSVRKASTDGMVSTLASINPFGMGGTLLGGLAIDPAGNIIVSDLVSHVIHKIAPNGSMTTIAGTGTAGFSGDGGPATAARLHFPRGVAVDSAGNIYIADSFNLRVRKISTDGTISTVAGGGGAYPGNNVQATQAKLNFPNGVGLDSQGNLYISAGWIQKVSADGLISVIAGNGKISYAGDGGPALAAQLYEPSDVVPDSNGNLYIMDRANSVIRKVNSAGIITTIAGNGTCGFDGDGGPAGQATLCLPSGAAFDAAGNLYVADSGNYSIRVITAAGIISTVAGNGTPGFSGDGGPAISAELNDPVAVAVDPSGNLFIADYENSRIRKVTKGGVISTIAGTGVNGFSGDGGLATNAQIFFPGALAVDSAGNLLFADTENSRVRMITPAGTISTIAGAGPGSYQGDGVSATAAHIAFPAGIATDGTGNLFISIDAGVIYKVSKAGIVTTIAGIFGSTNVSPDGVPAASASISIGPGGMRADANGRIYFADRTNSVRVLTPTSQNILIGSIVDAASQAATALSPGKIAVIYAAGMGTSGVATNHAQNGVYSTQFFGTSVTFNGVPAPLLYTSATQLAVITPYEITGNSAQVIVTYQGASSLPATVAITPTAPSLFSSSGTGAGQAAAVNADGSINDAAHPVKIGGYISLYATGEGITTPQATDGKLAPLAPPFAAPQASVTVSIGGQPATVLYAGAAPGEVAGLMQVVVQIPAGIQPGGYVPVILQAGSASTVVGAAWISVSN